MEDSKMLEDYALKHANEIREALSAKTVIVVVGSSSAITRIHESMLVTQIMQIEAREEKEAREEFPLMILEEAHYVKHYVDAGTLHEEERRKVRRAFKDGDDHPRKGWQTCHGPAKRFSRR